jgi:amino acid permease
MAQEGYLPTVVGRTNAHHAPWVAVVVIAAVSIAFIWTKPLSDAIFYYNAIVVTLALSYMSALAAFTRLMFARYAPWRAALISVLPIFGMAVLAYLMYSAGAEPADPKDKYQAWYIGLGVIGSSLLIVLFGGSMRAPASVDTPHSSEASAP